MEQYYPKRARVFSPEEQEIILNVYKYVKRVWPENRGSISMCSDKTAEITGLLRPAVYRVLRDRKLRRRALAEVVDEATLIAIRRKIYCFYHEDGHGVPRPENILREVNEDVNLPNFTMSTFRRVLHHLNYRHVITRNRYDAASRSETFSIPVV